MARNLAAITLAQEFDAMNILILSVKIYLMFGLVCIQQRSDCLATSASARIPFVLDAFYFFSKSLSPS